MTSQQRFVYCIYRIKFEDGTSYIGRTTDPKKRFKGYHLYKRSANKRLVDALYDFGYTMYELFWTDDPEKEYEFIHIYKSAKNGYNKRHKDWAFNKNG